MQATLAELLPFIAGARLVPGMNGDARFDGVSTDSRSVAPGTLFVALRGETFDAHDFLAQVTHCAAVVVEELPDGWTLPAILVPDTLVALGQIAHFWRRRFALPVIGVTGSNGKTTVKEMIAAILGAAFGVDASLATRGNLNNEIGVPLTLFRMDPVHRAAVIEMGMNHPGEIARLCAIAAPTLALVNNAQREHQEFMHSVAAVARENGAVLAGLAADGIAVFPHGDEFSDVWRSLAGARRVITFGLGPDADVSCSYRASEFGNDMQVSVRMDGATLQFPVRLAAAGAHNVLNALAAVACTFGIGVGIDAIARGLQAFAPVSGRLQKKRAANGATLIDDSYNANPDSVRAAIDVLALAPAPRFLVLGDMGEVGANGPEFHAEIGAYAVARGIQHVLTTGALARHVGGEHFDQFEAMLAALDGHLAGAPGATVLIKGSRFMKMERAVQHLIATKNNNKEVH